MLTLANNLMLLAENVAETSEHSLVMPLIIGGSIMLTFLILLLITASFSNNHTMGKEDIELIDPNRQVGSLGAGR
ncbi:hypothetical protein MHJ63_03065 [Pseudoglutamicibacter albus]|uniref:Uncharacterized protein n=1 Tax=Pseudoglutamicibacter albus DNF00011 TaxID=1401063 RepID=A0A095YEY8_9MICC|nr:hypothetical protein [Pseudoglutamicibacter albus]KGF20788.1 hypothetical protein HMPREF2128_03460 [Pseudoglutamicibacter albus DNF00011]MCG7304267.1 hypothetical protein [Pseudoglutamicibacter albus]